jgi:GH35 family endo-1,4-beta-xylanase
MSEFCNIATLPFYWDITEPEKGKTRYDKDSVKIYRRPPIDLCMEFCKENGIEPREHALAYEAFFPKWLYDASVDEVKSALENRYREIAERYAHRIPTIEVTNEMEWANGKTAFYNEPDYIEWCFKTADKYFPNNQLVINEYTSLCWEDKGRFTDKYYSYIDATILKGAKVDAIGMQYHQFFNREDEYNRTRVTYDPIQLYKHMDLYANFGKPLQITEITIPAYSWEAEDEEIQAKIIEYLYTIWFGHPNVEQIIYWNMVDGYAHLWSSDPEKIKASQGDMTIGENYYHGGLLRFDLSPKPAFYTIKNLFENVWHTEESLITDEKGEITFKGFFGEYEIELNDKKYTAKLDKDGENIIIEV